LNYLDSQKEGKNEAKIKQNNMKTEHLNSLIKQSIIKKQYENEYRLVRPLRIIIRKSVLDLLKQTYKPSYEEGGLLEAVAFSKGVIVVSEFHKVNNKAVVGYSYSPSTKEFESVINGIISRGNLPFAIHTHPVKLGIEPYDSKRSKFYLKPSLADKSIARDGITPYFNFPEAIFTFDERLGNGFGISFYTGFIFPASLTALSTLQIASLVAFGYAYYKKSMSLKIASGAMFLLDYFRRPQYDILKNGDLEIKLSE
jgi:hypothetical protein